MIFSFFKYTNPTWYFNRKPNEGQSIFATKKQLLEAGVEMDYDKQFISEKGKIRDLTYRAFQRGFINYTKEEGLDVWQSTEIPVIDEYRFLRKNLNPVWVVYVLLLRLLSLHNPITEINGFLKTRKTKRESYHKNPIEYQDYKDFQSPLLAQNKKVTVVIPTLNRYKYLKDVFRDLKKQTYKNFEVIVVDQTDPFDESVYKGWKLDLKYWYQEEKALWRARNEAVLAAKGDLILLYDDDSLVESDWIEQHIKTLDYFKADISSGVSISTVGAEVPAHYTYFRWSDQLDTGNVLFRKEVFDKIGLFDRQFEKQRMGDGEFGMRAYLAGLRNVQNPYAKRIHLKVGQGGLRQMGSWDAYRPKKFFAPRPVPSVLYLQRKYFGNKAAGMSLLKNVPPSIVPYQFKGNKAMVILGVFISVFLLPLIALQVIWSWRNSSSMLKIGMIND